MKLFATPLDVVIKFIISPPFANNFIIQTVEELVFRAHCLHLPMSTHNSFVRAKSLNNCVNLPSTMLILVSTVSAQC